MKPVTDAEVDAALARHIEFLQFTPPHPTSPVEAYRVIRDAMRAALEAARLVAPELPPGYLTGERLLAWNAAASEVATRGSDDPQSDASMSFLAPEPSRYVCRCCSLPCGPGAHPFYPLCLKCAVERIPDDAMNDIRARVRALEMNRPRQESGVR